MFIRPKPLKAKSKVAIISPSAGLPSIFPWVYERGLERIRQVFDLEPVEFPTAKADITYLAQNPKARAEDINAAFKDPSIDGIIATIGGNDQIKILPYLDKELIASNPKVFLGYSDNTNLHLFLWNLGIISYYAGAVMTQFASGSQMHPFTVDAFKKALFSEGSLELTSSPEYTDIDLDWADKSNLGKDAPMQKTAGWQWHNHEDQGVIEGRLWGGCLEVLQFHLCIHRYLPRPERLDGSVLFLETAEEMPPAPFIHRFLSALAELGLLQRFQAILVGYPKAEFCGITPKEGKQAFIEAQKKAILEALSSYNLKVPVIFNMNFGHTNPQLVIPSGANVKIDCHAQTIHVL